MALSFRAALGIQPSQPTLQDSVLLIVDVQNEYARGILKITDFEKSVAAIGALLERYRATGGDVIHILHDTPAGAPLFTPGTGLDEEYPTIAPRAGESVVHKNQPISFTDTNLEALIEKTGKKKLVIVGYMAHVCVSGTTRVAFEKGYDVTVVKDCIGDRDVPGATAEELVRVVLAELGDALATILSSDEISA